MKETIVSILQQRMDKCTSEQFWCVATLTGLNAFLIAQQKNVVAVLPRWVIVLAITVATIYGACYIIHRHISYYFYRARQVTILKNEEDTPDFLRKCPEMWKGTSLLGVVFYVGWIIGLWLMCSITYL